MSTAQFCAATCTKNEGAAAAEMEPAAAERLLEKGEEGRGAAAPPPPRGMLCAGHPHERASRRVLALGVLGTLGLVCAGMLVPRRCCGPPLLASPLPSVSEVKAAIAGLSVCATVVQTAHATHDRLSAKPCAPFVPDFASANVIDLTHAAPQQQIDGFGGAFTESSALVYQALPPALRQQFIDAYFSEETGIGYTLGRVHINSCDFSVNSYSFDDVPNDFALRFFDESVSHDQRTMIPLIRAAQAAASRKLQLLASPWSPPAWMKRSRQMDGSDPPPGLRDDCRDVWARYISKWVASYARLGVPIWAVTMQNEPENRAAWEACAYTPEQATGFVRDFLGPTLRAHHPALKIFAFDHNKDHVLEWANASFSDETASAYFEGIAFHWYAGDGFDALKEVRERWPDKRLLPSEATYEKYRWPPGTTLPRGSWSFGEGYAHDIIGDLNAGALGWIDWNLLLDEHGGPNHLGNDCDAAIMANVSAGLLHLHPQYFYVGHFSKYAPPGSRLLNASVRMARRPPRPPDVRPYGSCGAGDGLEAASFLRPDGKVATVVLNCGPEAVQYKLKSGGLALSMEIPAHAIQTVLHERGVGLGVPANESAPPDDVTPPQPPPAAPPQSPAAPSAGGGGGGPGADAS